MIELIKKGLRRPRQIIPYLLSRSSYGERMDDEKYIRTMYRLLLGYSPNLANPSTYCEKLNWLKLHDHNPLYTIMADKDAAKRYVADIIGEKYIIPTIGIYDSFDEINFDTLPDTFVIKATHDSGSTIICRDKSVLSISETRNRIEKALQTNYYYRCREWAYKDITPRIIIEEFIPELSERNYKFLCFDGKIGAVYVTPFRESEVDFFDEEFNHLDIHTRLYTCADKMPLRPPSFDEMKYIATKLSAGFPHFRVDLYDVNGRIYFGEIAFYFEGGFVPFIPDRWNRYFGDMMDLALVNMT